MTNPHQSGAGQWIQSNGRQRQAFGGFFGLEVQHIAVRKFFGYWPQWISVDAFHGSMADQAAARKFYRAKVTDCTHILEGHSISFRAVERYAQGHCPLVSGMPGELIAAIGPPLNHQYTGDDKNFSHTGTGPRDDMLSVITNESGPTLRRLVRQGSRFTQNTSEDWRQELTEPEPLNQILGPVFSNARTRDWSAFPTASAGDSDFSFSRAWYFDEFRSQWPVDYVLNTNTIPTPDSFTEALSPNDQTGIAGGFIGTIPALPMKPSHNFDWIAEPSLFSGWATTGSVVFAPNGYALRPEFVGLRCRFRINGRKAYPYFVVRFRFAEAGVGTIISSPTLISSGTAYPGRAIELPFFADDEDAPSTWASVGSTRLQIGEGYFAVIDETFQAWSARISGRIF